MGMHLNNASAAAFAAQKEQILRQHLQEQQLLAGRDAAALQGRGGQQQQYPMQSMPDITSQSHAIAPPPFATGNQLLAPGPSPGNLLASVLRQPKTPTSSASSPKVPPRFYP